MEVPFRAACLQSGCEASFLGLNRSGIIRVLLQILGGRTEVWQANSSANITWIVGDIGTGACEVPYTVVETPPYQPTFFTTKA
eukprot:scaffold1996_cov127-Cylindrotheca_fusiformis.AAC.9